MGKNKKGEPKTQKQIPNQWIDFIENLGEPIGERNQNKEWFAVPKMVKILILLILLSRIRQNNTFFFSFF